MMQVIRRLLPMLVLFLSVQFLQAQSAKKDPKPYKVLTQGKQFTIKSTRNLAHIMVWTADGHRVVEQRDIQQPTYTFTVPAVSQYFFLMVGMEGGKVYTEKIGVR